MTSCTYPGCRDRAVSGLHWTEYVDAGWVLTTTERVFCSYHTDEAVARLKLRDIKVSYTSFGTPVV